MIETRTLFTSNEGEARAESYLDRFRAPFSLRCGALLIDYILVAGIIAFSTLLARMGNRPRASASSAEVIGIFIAVVVAAINFLAAGLARADARQVGDGFGHPTQRGRAFSMGARTPQT